MVTILVHAKVYAVAVAAYMLEMLVKT